MWSIALQSFERAIAFDEHCLAAWEGKAEALRQMGRWNEAVEADQRIISLRMVEERQDSDFYLKQGDAFYDSDRNEEAIVSYEKAIEFKPDDASAFYNRACCYSLMGNLALALEDLTIDLRSVTDQRLSSQP